MALTDALGNLVRIALSLGRRFDTVTLASLIDGVEPGGLITDKAFDSDTFIAELNERGARFFISQDPRRASRFAPTKPTRASKP